MPEPTSCCRISGSYTPKCEEPDLVQLRRPEQLERGFAHPRHATTLEHHRSGRDRAVLTAGQAPLRITATTFCVTRWPRTAPVSAASANFIAPLVAFHTALRRRLLAP